MVLPRDLRIRRLHSNRIWMESKEMCGTTDSSFQSSNTLNNTGVWSLIELASLYTVPLSAVSGLSRLTTTTNGQARPIRKFSNRPMTFESNRIGTAESNRISKLRRSLVLPVKLLLFTNITCWNWLGLTVKTWPPNNTNNDRLAQLTASYQRRISTPCLEKKDFTVFSTYLWKI